MLGRGLVGRVGGGAGAEAGEFQGAVGGFGSAVGEEDAVHAGDFRELAGERTLKGVVIEVREVDGARGFAANDFNDARMGVAEGVNGDATKKIEIFLARGVIHISAATMRDDERLALVSGEEKLFGVAQARVELRLAAEGALWLLHR